MNVENEKEILKMKLRHDCPCDLDGICPYDAESGYSCAYWCGEDEPQDTYYEEDEYYDV